ncbi:MAG: DMT family transporter [Candidatus Acidiferrales bacterium]|jgi:drug/metabolite transporter (DMT)-like permease
MNRRVQADLALVLCSIMWGATFVIVKNALVDSSVFVFMAVRFTLGALLMIPLYRRALRNVDRAELWAGVVCGLSLFGGYVFQTGGLVTTTASKGAFITGSSVAMVPILLMLFWKRSIGAAVWIGVIAAMVGIYFLTVPGGAHNTLVIGDFLVLIGAVAFALQIIFVSLYGVRHSGGAIGFLQIATVAVFSLCALPLAAVTHAQAPRLHWSPAFVWGIAITAVLTTAAAFSIQVWAQQFTTATHAALIFALEPVVTAVTSRIFQDEHLGRRALIGAALILVGIVLAEIKGSSALPHRAGEKFDEQATEPLGGPPA